ncbi:hypothetical protein ACTFIU_009561 [Dictyostelium citrinum]
MVNSHKGINSNDRKLLCLYTQLYKNKNKKLKAFGENYALKKTIKVMGNKKNLKKEEIKNDPQKNEKENIANEACIALSNLVNYTDILLKKGVPLELIADTKREIFIEDLNKINKNKIK